MLNRWHLTNDTPKVYTLGIHENEWVIIMGQAVRNHNGSWRWRVNKDHYITYRNFDYCYHYGMFNGQSETLNESKKSVEKFFRPTTEPDWLFEPSLSLLREVGNAPK